MTNPKAPASDEIIATNKDQMDDDNLAAFMSRSFIALDGLWFLHVLEALGPQKVLEMDTKVIASQFKLSTRQWRKLQKLDGKSIQDKKSIFSAMARLYGHTYEIRTNKKSVTMRLHKCGIYENLKKAGRLSSHDCTLVCRKIAPVWFKEMEPRTDGRGKVDLQIPHGGSSCDWTIAQPDDENSP